MKDNLRFLLAAVLSSILLVGHVYAETAKPQIDSVRQALNTKLIPGMLISNLKLDGIRANINGTSPTNANISQFLRNLTQSPNFARVELVSLQQKGSTMHFVMTADIQCPSQGSTNIDNLCAKPVAKTGTVFKCSEAGKTVFQDRPCAKSR